MKQIKTIKNRLDNAEDFDKAVNEALADGWELTQRKVLQPQAQSNNDYTHIMLYAELEKITITEAERCCDNCEHSDLLPETPPCKFCKDASHWEQAR